MERRSFLALSAGPLAGPLAGHVARLHGRRQRRSYQPLRQLSGRAPSIREPRGILLRVRLSDCAGWYPRSWRDVPPAPFTVCQAIAGQSLAACRIAAKQHNQQQLKLGACSWLIVVATDGRKAKGGAA